MVRLQETTEPIANEMENIIQESREMILQALELQSTRLKEKAERDSRQIIAKAQEEADEIIGKAKQEAVDESERIIDEAKHEARQILKKSLEESAVMRQDSERIVNETRQKASEIIAEMIERGTTRARHDLARESMSKTSRMLAQISKTIEEIVEETGNDIQNEFDNLTSIIAEAEEKLQALTRLQDEQLEIEPETSGVESELEEVEVDQEEVELEPESQAEEIELEPESESESPVISEIESTDRYAPAGMRVHVKDNDGDKLFKGRVKLEIVTPYNQEHQGGIPEWMADVTGLRIVSSGGYIRSNRRISTYSIDLKQPVPLVKQFKTMSAVKNVTDEENNIVVTLK